jgi:hypothetical protein
VKNIQQKIAESNSTVVSKSTAESLDMSIEENQGKEWWEYDSANNTYSVMGWDSESGEWEVKSIESATGITEDGHYVAKSTSEINAANVKSGSKLYVTNEEGDAEEYVAIGGEWALMRSGSGGGTTVNNIGNDNEAEFNRQLEEEQATNPNVLSKTDAEALAESDRAGIEWWEYDLSLSRYYIWKWDSDVSAWYIDVVKEINPYQETSIIAYRQLNKRYLAEKLSALPASKVGNGISLDLDNGFGELSAYLSMNGQWVAVEDDSYIQVDDDGAFNLSIQDFINSEGYMPDMTSNTSNGLTLTANYQTTPIWQLFNRESSWWSAGQNGGKGTYTIDFKYPVKLMSYDMTAYNITSEAPKDWTIQGSNDNTNFVIIDEVEGNSFTSGGEIKDYYINTPGNYRYYKYDFTRNNGASYSAIAEMQYYEYKDVELSQELDQSNWVKYQVEMPGISYKYKSDEGEQTVSMGDYVLDVDNDLVYKRLGGEFTANLKSDLSGGGINYRSTASWEEIGEGNGRIYVADKIKKIKKLN